MCRKAASAPGTPQICKTLVCSEAFPLRLSFQERKETTSLPYPSSTERRPEDCFCQTCSAGRITATTSPSTCAAPPFPPTHCCVGQCISPGRYSADSDSFLCRKHYFASRIAPTFGRPQSSESVRSIRLSVTIANPNLQCQLHDASPYHDVRRARSLPRDELRRRGAVCEEVPELRECDECASDGMQTYCVLDSFTGQHLCTQHHQ